MRGFRFAPARVLALAAVAALALARPEAARAQEMDVPLALQAALMARVIAFDRNVPPATRPVRIIVVYQEGNRASTAAAHEIEKSLRKVMVGERPIEVRLVNIDSRDLTEALAAEQPFAAYLTPIRAVELGRIVKCLRAAQVRSFSGVPAYARAGIAVGIGALGDRPRLYINLSASRAEGADYQSALLQLAEVIP